MFISQSIQKAVMNAFKQISRQQQKAYQAFSSTKGDDNNNNDDKSNADGTTKVGKKQAINHEVYTHKTNYNMEEFKQYTQDVQQALKELSETQEIIDNSTPFDLLPRRKRRVYDRPLHDLDISNYECWRTYDKMLYKTHKHAARVVCKINLSPRQLRHAFGEGNVVTRNESLSTREYDFEDCNMDAFLLYDYKATTGYHGPNDPNYDYKENVEEKKIKSPHPTPSEFWDSDEVHPFRVNCNNYADFHKFKKWVETEVAKRVSDKSYEEKIIERFGPYEIYDQYEKKYELDKDPSVYKFGREYYLEKGKKFSEKEIEQNPYLKPIKPAKQMEEQNRVAWPYQWYTKPSK